jgi:hypothetical protein
MLALHAFCSAVVGSALHCVAVLRHVVTVQKVSGDCDWHDAPTLHAHARLVSLVYTHPPLTHDARVHAGGEHMVFTADCEMDVFTHWDSATSHADVKHVLGGVHVLDVATHWFGFSWHVYVVQYVLGLHGFTAT